MKVGIGGGKEGRSLKEMGMWVMMKRRRRKQQQEAALRLSVSFHIQVYSHICAQT